jgi:hypothetical protein
MNGAELKLLRVSRDSKRFRLQFSCKAMNLTNGAFPIVVRPK